jgi:hypothetical protein
VEPITWLMEGGFLETDYNIIRTMLCATEQKMKNTYRNHVPYAHTGKTLFPRPCTSCTWAVGRGGKNNISFCCKEQSI